MANEVPQYVLIDVREYIDRFTRTGQCVLKALTLVVTDHHVRVQPKTVVVSERDAAVIFISPVRFFAGKIALYF